MDRILRSSGEKFQEFFPVHFGKIYKIAHTASNRRARHRYRQRFACMKCPSSDVIEWVEGCLDRLAAVGANTIVTQLPMDSVDRVSAAQISTSSARCCFRNVRSQLSEAKRSAAQLNERLVEIGDTAKNADNSSVRRVVRLRSDSSQAVDVGRPRGQQFCPRGATSMRPHRRRAHRCVVGSTCSVWRRSNGRFSVASAAAINRPACSTTEQRFRCTE